MACLTCPQLCKERTYRHITVDQDEIFGFRINNAGFFAKYGYPWLYRQEDETDDRLFGLIATNNLLDVKEDLRRSAQEEHKFYCSRRA